MNWWKRLLDKLLALFSKTKLTDEELIAYGRQLERQEMQKRTYVWIDPTIRPYSQVSAYEPPERRTDPAQFGIRRRAALRRFQMQPVGTLLHRHNEIQQQQAQACKLDPETAMLPSMTAPEDDWTNGGIDQTIRMRATRP